MVKESFPNTILSRCVCPTIPVSVVLYPLLSSFLTVFFKSCHIPTKHVRAQTHGVTLLDAR